MSKDQVDLASLHSALESEAGEREVKEGLEWTVEEVWVDKGTTEATLAVVIVSSSRSHQPRDLAGRSDLLRGPVLVFDRRPADC
jgi:hypothetical protein